jgi:hypothetical protein
MKFCGGCNCCIEGVSVYWLCGIPYCKECWELMSPVRNFSPSVDRLSLFNSSDVIGIYK